MTREVDPRCREDHSAHSSARVSEGVLAFRIRIVSDTVSDIESIFLLTKQRDRLAYIVSYN